MNLEVIPLLIVALLWIGVDAPDVDDAEILLAGHHEVTDHRGALIVADAEVEVPGGAEVPGPVYLLGGRTRIDGEVAGDVVQLAGELDVAATGTVAGRLHHVAGSQAISEEAAVGSRRSLQPAPDAPGPLAGYGFLVAVTAVLAVIAARRANRSPAALATVGKAVVGHPGVSLTVGALVAVTGLALCVFMAFTLLLLPVAVAGIVAGLVVLGYAVIALGSVVGQRLGARVGVSRVGLASAGGVVLVMAGLEVLTALPWVGAALALAVLLTAFGAVLITYFGLQEFRPVPLPD